MFDVKSKRADLILFATGISRALDVDAGIVKKDLTTWFSCQESFTSEKFGEWLTRYLASHLHASGSEFRLSYAEYAKLTGFLPSKGGKDTVVVLKRNEDNDLLFGLEGDTNITQFGLPSE